MSEQIIKAEYSEVMQKSYIDYAMSVICARALPDIRDGLQPVQRRVLYAMNDLGLRYDRPHRKSARIVGDTMGKYHPHGDSSISEALVVMEQDFKKGMALIDGHGNFGSIEGDGAAAMRYTEAKLKKFTQDVYLSDLDKNVVDFVPNFDETEKEPAVLPVRIPNILINGAEGIAVGMTTNIPPHNLNEVIEAEKYAEEDKKRKEVVDTKNSLDQMIAGIEKVVKESGDKISEEDKTKLNSELESAKDVQKNSDDIEKLKASLESLTKVSNEIFTKLYSQANPNGAQGASDGANGQGGSGSTDPNNFGDYTTK